MREDLIRVNVKDGRVKVGSEAALHPCPPPSAHHEESRGLKNPQQAIAKGARRA
jgi:hypothetical protein